MWEWGNLVIYELLANILLTKYFFLEIQKLLKYLVLTSVEQLKHFIQ